MSAADAPTNGGVTGRAAHRLGRILRQALKRRMPQRLEALSADLLERLEIRLRLLRRRGSPFISGYLDGLKGVEIGAASHNPFYLDAINVDRYAGDRTIYKEQERRLAGRTVPVDVVAPGDELPFADNSYDFVFASHVIEHFPDPLRALAEWVRVARRYVVVVVPHRDRTFDRERELTSVAELLQRHCEGFTSEEDEHWSVWTCESFIAMCEAVGLRAIDRQDPDDKVGNGFTVVIDASSAPEGLRGPQHGTATA